MEDDPVRAMDDLITRLRGVLAGPAPSAGEPRTGTSDDGLVSADVGPDGYVRSITAHPSLLRRPADELTDDITTAVNRALDARPDTSTRSNVLQELSALQEESAAQLAQLSGNLVASVKRLQPRQP